MHLRFIACFIVALLATFTFAGSNVNVGRYDAVHVVPAPGAVAADGDLGEWDKSGEFFTYRFEEQKDRYYYQGYMMYDTARLYLAAHVGDSTPMMNMHDPATEATVAWAGDCLQVRISTDAKLGWPLPAQSDSDGIVHLTLWYYTGKKQPCLMLQYGMDYHGQVINPPGFQAGYKTDADGKGYTLEFAIPWMLLGAGEVAPKGGDVLACTWQMLWGDAQGRDDAADLSEVRNPNNAGFVYQDAGSWGKAIYEKAGHLPPGTVKAREQKAKPDTGFLPITYTIPGKEPAQVSMHIADAQGHTVRWLLGNAVREAGTHTELWNGLDNDGKPAPPGTYTAHWCYSRGVRAKLLASADNPGYPPYNTSDNTGSWAGDYQWPVAVCATDKHIFLAHEAGEASRVLVKLTPDGKRIWGNDTTLDLTLPVKAMATDGASLYVLQGGEFFGGKSWNKTYKAGFVKLSCENGFLEMIGDTKRSYLILNDPEHNNGVGVAKELTGIAVNADTVFVSSQDAGVILCIDKATGKQIRTIGGFDRPRGLASGPQGKLYVVTAFSVLRMNPDGGARETLVPETFWKERHILDPWTITVAKNGEFFVAMHGSEQRVLHFAADGAFLNGIGRRGGLITPGPWVKDAMRNPQGICLAPDGKLWVTEGADNPKRTSVWLPDGAFVTDFIGPAPYSADSTLDPEQPEYVYVDGTKFHLDFKTGQNEPVAVVGGNFGTSNSDGRFIHFKGRTFLAAGTLSELRDGRFVTLASECQINTRTEINWGTLFTGIFTDRNLDGVVQPGEQQFFPNWGGLWPPHIRYIADNLDMYFGRSTYQYFFRVPFEGFDANGLPIYNTDHLQMIFVGQQERLKDYPGAKLYPFGTPYGAAIESVLVDRVGSIYMLINNGAETIKRGQTLLDKGHRLVKFTPQGDLLWEYRNIVVSHPASRNTTISKPGEIHGAIKFTGLFGRYLTLGSYYGQYHVLDSMTGLYITSFTPDTRTDPPLDEFAIFTENFNGHACYSERLKKYLYCGGDAQARVWEVLGLDGVKFATLPITVAPADVEKALAASKVELGVPPIKQVYLAGMRGVQVDGNLADWDGADWVNFGVDDARKGRAALRWWMNGADGYLAVAFDITDDSPMLNRGGNNNLLFKTGDAVEFCLSAADPDADRKAEKPLIGDQRVLITLVKDESGKETPIAVIYEPKSTRPDKLEATFSSPTGKEVYDYVAPVKGAQIMVKRREGGYVVEAVFKAKELGFTTLEGNQRLRADFGALFSDKGGVITLTRALWADNYHEVSVNNDIPTESRLHPWLWGWVVLR